MRVPGRSGPTFFITVTAIGTGAAQVGCAGELADLALLRRVPPWSVFAPGSSKSRALDRSDAPAITRRAMALICLASASITWRSRL